MTALVASCGGTSMELCLRSPQNDLSPSGSTGSDSHGSVRGPTPLGRAVSAGRAVNVGVAGHTPKQVVEISPRLSSSGGVAAATAAAAVVEQVVYTVPEGLYLKLGSTRDEDDGGGDAGSSMDADEGGGQGGGVIGSGNSVIHPSAKRMRMEHGGGGGADSTAAAWRAPDNDYMMQTSPSATMAAASTQSQWSPPAAAAGWGAVDRAGPVVAGQARQPQRQAQGQACHSGRAKQQHMPTPR